MSKPEMPSLSNVSSSRSFPLGFAHAFRGITSTFLSERNFRIECSIATLALYFSSYYSFSTLEFIALLLTIGVVLAAELFNTSLEHTVDLSSPEWNILAKKAKDASAGAVLLLSLISVGVGLSLFWDLPILTTILSDILSRWLLWSGLLLILLFVVFFPNSKAYQKLKKNSPTMVGKEG